METRERRQLASCFAPQPGPDFESWAFSASEYEQVARVITERAPEILGRLQRPASERDLSLVAHCSLALRFDTDPNGAESVPHALRDGTPIEGAWVSSAKALLYSSGLAALPTIDGRFVYFFQPESREGNAAQIASSIFKNCGEATRQGLAITFPEARTGTVVDYDWVMQLASEDGLYQVVNCVNSGEAILNYNGFFARETQVLQVAYYSMPEARHEVVIDDPFVVFFADATGVHAAAWFDRDSFRRLS